MIIPAGPERSLELDDALFARGEIDIGGLEKYAQTAQFRGRRHCNLASLLAERCDQPLLLDKFSLGFLESLKRLGQRVFG